MIFGKYINKYYLKHAGRLLLGLAALALVDYMQLIVPELYRTVVNGINDGAVYVRGATVPFDMDFLLDSVCRPMLFVILSLVFGRFLWRVCIFGAAIKVERDLRDRMFDAAKDLSASFYSRNRVGSLMSLFTNDLETVQECFGSGFLSLFDALLLGGMAIFKMWRMDPALTGLSLIPMALLLAVSGVIGKTMTRRWARRQEAFSGLSDFAQESFSGIAVIKAYVMRGKELLAFKEKNIENEQANVSFAKASVLLKILTTLLIESVICVILGYGGFLVWRGVFNAGQLVEYIGYFNSIVWPVMAISELIDMSSRGKASSERITELLDAVPEMRDAPDVSPLPEIRGEIEFRNLSFTYPDADKPSLTDVSFTVKAGESVAIVGKTGSGKTTLAELLLRVYPVEDGTLFLDGRDVNTLPIRQVRGASGYVPQDNFLFSDTIANNIAFAADGASAQDIERAAVTAGVDGDIRGFADGYDSVLGERGVTVSGGQKQRISIARALLKDAPILILDDSLSAVDTETEREILRNLASSRAGRTTILISHRISAVEHMDKIIFLADGAVADFGTHGELCARCEGYRRMVELQKLEEEGGDLLA